MKKQAFITMEDHEFEDIVNKAYGITDFSFGADQLVGHDATCTFSATKKEKLADYEIQQLEELAKGQYDDFLSQVIIQDLVNKDILEPADYLIETL